MDAYDGHSPYATLPGNIHRYALRTLFEEYRDAGGSCWVDADPPELSVASETSEISCMAKMTTPIGIPYKGTYIGLAPRRHGKLSGAVKAVIEWVAEAMDSGDLWCPPNSSKVQRRSHNRWTMDQKRFATEKGKKIVEMGEETSRVLDLVEQCGFNPLSVSTVHAAMESSKTSNEHVFERVYPYPRTTIPSTGLHGTDHNNSFVDISPWEEDKEPDLASRELRDEYVGYICASYTSHSYEAGKARRVTPDVAVRLMDYRSYRALERVCNRGAIKEGESEDWTFFCAGQYCAVTKSTVDQICIMHRLMSMSSDPGFGFYIRSEARVCVMSVCSGTLTKLCSNGVWADNVNTYASDHTQFSVKPRIDREGPDFMRACLSGHYGYTPFIEHNAAVRTSISAAQTTQAVCLPYCPATASVSPVYTFSPVVTTVNYKRIMIEQEKTLDLASYLPGMDLCVLYHNLEHNYEDADLVCKTFVQNGGFSTVSTCRYLLPASDYAPPVGKMVCSRLSAWWKSPCQKHCKHTKEFVENCTMTSPFTYPTAVVTSKKILKSGEQSIRVRSYETFQAANKISLTHGQKGVDATLVSREDMPVCYTKDGVEIIPDLIMAVGSIVSRQTLGQIYESGAQLQRLKDPDMEMVIQPDSIAPLGEDVEVYDGRDWSKFVTAVKDKDGNPSLKDTVATIGYARVLNQSQMSRERHFTSHRSMTAKTLRTPIKRSRGGALRDGEMEVQAMVAAGLTHCAEELRKRGDEVVILVCTRCQRLRLLHSCTVTTEFAEVTLPYDMVVLDCVNKIVHNCTFKYTLEPDV